MMDIKQMQYFVTVAYEKNITKAAQKLYMAQPPLSRQIITIEREMGVDLFVRTRQGFELTEAGSALLVKVQDILMQIDELKTSIQSSPQQIEGILNIGTLVSCSSIIVHHLLLFHNQFPQVNYRLWEDTPHQLLELLRKREVELVFLRTPTFDPGDFAVAELASEKFYLALPREMDTFPDYDYAEMEHIASLPLVLLHEGIAIGYNELILAEFHKRGFQPRIICQCPNSSLALLLVMGGMGASILPQMVVNQFHNEQYRCKPIIDFPVITKPVVIWDQNRYLSTKARLLLTHLGVQV